MPAQYCQYSVISKSAAVTVTQSHKLLKAKPQSTDHATARLCAFKWLVICHCNLPTVQRLSSTLATYKHQSFLSYYFHIFDNTWLCHSIMQNSECINIYNSTTWFQAETYKVLYGQEC